VQVLVVNLLTDGLPAIALARDPASSETMRRPPARARTLLGRELTLVLGAAGLAVGLVATGAYLAGRELDPGAAQTMAFATVALAELIFVFSVRTPTRPAWRGSRNVALLLAVVGSVILVAAAIYLPVGRELTGTEALGPVELALVLGLSFVPLLIVEAAKVARR
jgi:Ca2+-transporting ATPase